MQAIIDKEGGGFKLAAWDWWYYAEKVKKEKYDLDESMLRPYFKMENVRKGAFDVAEKLYGITFVKRDDIQVYAPDVEVFEVKEADGKHLGIFYSDYYPRDGKRAGAWSSGFRSQSNIDGKFVTPLVYNVGNFSKPTADKPSLMSIDEVQTLFHELGHGLNSLFGNTVYSGSRSTPRDFVELPSQIMENWATDPAVMKTYAVHYQTGAPIPQELIDKLEKSRHFNQGFETVEYLAASFLDMDWHVLAEAVEPDAAAFEKASLNKIGLIPEIEPRYREHQLQPHLFGRRVLGRVLQLRLGRGARRRRVPGVQGDRPVQPGARRVVQEERPIDGEQRHDGAVRQVPGRGTEGGRAVEEEGVGLNFRLFLHSGCPPSPHSPRAGRAAGCLP